MRVTSRPASSAPAPGRTAAAIRCHQWRSRSNAEIVREVETAWLICRPEATLSVNANLLALHYRENPRRLCVRSTNWTARAPERSGSVARHQRSHAGTGHSRDDPAGEG